MVKNDVDSQTSVPYERLVDSTAADFVIHHQHLRENSATKTELPQEIGRDFGAHGNQQSVSFITGMGAGEPQATSAEHEELFAQYREDDEKISTTPIPSSNHSEEETDQMGRGKRNDTNSRTFNRVNERVSTFSRSLMLANILANGLMFAVAGYITYHCFNKATVLFSWHPAFMSIGFLILMSQAVLTISGTNFFTHRCNHRTKVFIHWLLQAVAGILITIAAVCIFLNKIRMGKPHFQTLHGIFGLVTVCLTLISISGGVVTKYAFQLRQYMRPIYSKLIHGIGGTIAYLFGVATIGLGVYSKWFQEDNDAYVRLTLVIAIGAIALYVIIVPIMNTIQRFKTAARNTL